MLLKTFEIFMEMLPSAIGILMLSAGLTLLGFILLQLFIEVLNLRS